MASSSSKASFQLVLPVFLVFLAEYCFSLEATLMANSGVFKVACIAEERKALLKFKQGLKDSSGRLSSWVGEDCCKWMGVGCSNQTGNVIKLDLSNPSFCIKESKASTDPMRQCLGGELDPSLLNLTSLNYLDLSYNNFQGIPIPSFIGSLQKLRYLDLSQSSFGGMVPPHLGNLSNLLHLDLTTHSYPLNPWGSDLNWVSSLSSLQYLGLGGVNLSMTTTHWLPAVHMLPSLLELHLSGCHLDDLPQSLPYVNFTSLLVVDLSYNYFNTSLPHWLFNISTLVTVNLKHGKFTGSIPEMAWKSSHCSLQSFDLSANSVSGQVEEFVGALSRCSNSSLKMLDFSFNNIDGILPESLGSLKHLETLRFRANSLSGPIPTTIGNLSHLQDLDLSFNMMSGTIPESIGQLTQLHKLYLRGIRSSWKGIISEVHFQNLTNLAIFSISSFNSLVFHISPEWLPVFNLYSLSISDCQLMTPAFPAWLRTQTSLSKIILINVGISDTIPNWFWRKSPNDYFWSLDHVDLSNNQLRGQLPDSIDFLLGTFINLNNNCLEGSLPLWPTVTTLRLASNRFSGPIPLNIGQEMPYMRILELSWNYLNGTIPTSISKMENLTAVDLSSNYLSGYIPNDWKGLQKLTTIDFSNNNLFGQIPSSMYSQLPALKWLRLSNNNLSGELQTSLQRCEMLFTLDLRENKFSGTIPKWIGENLHGLSYLLLGANMFTGNMPQQICDLPYLQVLNLSHNNLSGSIPRCMGNLEQMKHRGNASALATFLNMMYPNLQHMDLKVKGDMGYEYYHILSLINSIDLSTNNLRGEIPEEIANLSALGSLNLSRNQLTGKIPEGFGRLQSLETLDLSINHLWGPIPLDMTSMTSLSKLNLSYNNLSGPIPSTNQFHTLDDPTIYEGNSGLCGPPLTTQCSTSNNEDPKVKQDVDEDRSGKIWFYVSTSLGFIVGFWAVFGSLVIKRSWRHAYFQFLDKMKDRLSFW